MNAPLPLLAVLSVLAMAGLAAESTKPTVLHSRDARIEGQGSAKYESRPEQQNIGVWNTTNTVVKWPTASLGKGVYRVVVVFACSPGEEGSDFEVTVGSQRAAGVTVSTGGWTRFAEMDLGPVILRKDGPVDVAVRVIRIKRHWGINLRELRLIPER